MKKAVSQKQKQVVHSVEPESAPAPGLSALNRGAGWNELLLMSAPVLVLDDALASVDNNTAAAILDSIRAQDDRTIVMISHQLSAAAACDRILVMENGRIVQQGHHNALIQQPGVYKRLWERQQASQQLDALAS